MPVKLKTMFKKGWKAEERERYANCLVVQFIDVNTERVLFEYAPQVYEQDLWENVFAALREYSDKIEFLKELETRYNAKFGVELPPPGCGKVDK